MKVFYKQRRFIKGDKAGDLLTTGWLPPLPDMRDYSNDHPVISELSMKLGIDGSKKLSKTPFLVMLILGNGALLWKTSLV